MVFKSKKKNIRTLLKIDQHKQWNDSKTDQ
jgi:hypothetical protein